MRALTILQPHAYFIFADAADLIRRKIHSAGGAPLTPKRVENRGQYMGHRGDLLIHAGLSRNWFTRDWECLIDEGRIVFGAILGLVNVLDCVELDTMPDTIRRKYPWLPAHQHTHGPQCIVFNQVRRFRQPVPWKGKQGLWNPEQWGEESELPKLRLAIENAIPVAWEPT